MIVSMSISTSVKVTCSNSVDRDLGTNEQTRSWYLHQQLWLQLIAATQ
jgi:hypothetical protein